MLTTATSVGRIAAQHARGEAAVVGELDDDLVRAGDHVVVRQHDAALSTMNPEPSPSCFSRLRAARHAELLAQHPAPRVLHREAADELRALDGDDRALHAIDERRDRALAPRPAGGGAPAPRGSVPWRHGTREPPRRRGGYAAIRRRCRASDHRASGQTVTLSPRTTRMRCFRSLPPRCART
jgi:hypothetical protein